MLRLRLAIEMSINHRESMRQEQLYAPALLGILLLFGPWPLPLYFKTQYLKWSILLSNILYKMCSHPRSQLVGGRTLINLLRLG
jgi:hypothetical protein